jgi:hypothetical protein
VLLAELGIAHTCKIRCLCFRHILVVEPPVEDYLDSAARQDSRVANAWLERKSDSATYNPVLSQLAQILVEVGLRHQS